MVPRLRVYPVEVTFLKPQRCAVESAYMQVIADVFTKIEVRSLAGHLPRHLADRYTIVAGCT